MEGDANSWLNEDYLSYVFMLIIYSGLGSWLVTRFTRDRMAVRRERRAAIRENLELMEKLGALRGALSDAERARALELMNQRLLDETTGRVEELNTIAAQEAVNPARGYLILPPPRTPFAVFVSLVFAFCLYVSIGSLLVLGLAYFQDGGYNPLDSPTDMTWTLKLVGLSVGALILGFAARFLTYRLYNQRTLTMRRIPTAGGG